MAEVPQLKTAAVVNAARHVVQVSRTGTLRQCLDAIDLLAIRLEDLDALAEGDALGALPKPEE